MNTDFKTLVSKDSKGKIRVVEIFYEGDETTRIYTILDILVNLKEN